MSFAKVAIVGNLGRDPETRYTPSGTLNVQFTIAASGRRRSSEGQGQGQGQDQDNTTWFRVTAWDRLADRLVNLMERGYIGRGRLLYVEGQLEARPYTDRDGQQRMSLDVTMTDFQFVGARQDNQEGGNQGGSYGGGGGGSLGGGGGYGGGQRQNQSPSFDDEGSQDMNDVPF